MEKLNEYAALLVRAGVNIQRGQSLNILSPVECADLARLCVEEAYAAGAREVSVIWNDDAVSRLKYLYAHEDVFDEMPRWQGMQYDDQLAIGAARLAIIGADPLRYKGVSPDRLQRWNQAVGKRLEAYSAAQMANQFQWCIGAYATKAWARQVFDRLDETEAVEKLWTEIFRAVRVEGDGGAVDRWADFVARMNGRVERLNTLNFRYLRYQNALGTDLEVELPQGHYWSGAAENSQTGIPFIANMPSEEIFTAPKRDGINGTVVASKPLVLDGNIVEEIRMTIRDGEIIQATARQGEDVLQKALDTDEGARYLGEVALVPWDSPISNGGLLFYETLYDENASCHFAFGEAYPMVEGAAAKSREEKRELGLNQSFIHEDFMIGTEDLSIVGVTQKGMDVPVFIDGNFAF